MRVIYSNELTRENFVNILLISDPSPDWHNNYANDSGTLKSENTFLAQMNQNCVKGTFPVS